jgi:Na+-transporting methylmalonyl-CoA/oxaloacetate decarboxylase gamma subunit
MSNLLISLQITAIGMGLVFGAIILLWWMMSLLTGMTAEKDASTAPNVPASPKGTMSDSPQPAPVMEKDHKAQAAAIAVAMAIAGQQQAQPLSEPPTALISAWQLGMRTRQMYEKGGR